MESMNEPWRRLLRLGRFGRCRAGNARSLDLIRIPVEVASDRESDHDSANDEGSIVVHGVPPMRFGIVRLQCVDSTASEMS
jgi:hypothetical protein